MFVLVLVTCMSLSGDTHCQTFERDHRFASLERCQFAAAVERGQYAERRKHRRDWLKYSWTCETDRLTG